MDATRTAVDDDGRPFATDDDRRAYVARIVAPLIASHSTTLSSSTPASGDGLQKVLVAEVTRYAEAHGLTFGAAVRALSAAGELEARYRTARNAWHDAVSRVTG